MLHLENNNLRGYLRHTGRDIGSLRVFPARAGNTWFLHQGNYISLVTYYRLRYNIRINGNEIVVYQPADPGCWYPASIPNQSSSLHNLEKISEIRCILQNLPGLWDIRYISQFAVLMAPLERMIVAGYAIIFETVSVILTIATIYRLKNFKTSHEKKLIIVTSSHTLVAFIFILYETSMIFKFTDPISVFVANYHTTIGYFFLCFNFYTILVADSRIRRDFWRILVFWRKKKMDMKVSNVNSNNFH
ncbi:unnamed protein product [Caenorhabditis angaria]|uniref:Serpentine receptor class gamma n=1 Tax=Caenorhabditis angaria TaxID=860376 RepID=A0A9P1IHA1_9PELO|nr:unnamed protein product [Caenorhabditis angaria]